MRSVLLDFTARFSKTELEQSKTFASIIANQENLSKSIERLERALREELTVLRESHNLRSQQDRTENGNALKNFKEDLFTQMRDLSSMQKDQLVIFAGQLKSLSETVEGRLKSLQDDNNTKLEQMRHTVDEKLQSTLEKRLGESFKFVSDRLEQVHKGLGEMQSLATGVGDLKKVLTNVKTRGVWGEVQLANLLEQMLSPEQYAATVATKRNSQERVDFAIKLPGADDQDQVWLPLDAKFPQEDYQRLIEAQESGNIELAEQAVKQLEARIKLEAKSIRDKYIDPPATTDFAILFVPTEGLYAEILRRPGLADSVQRDFRIVIAGPTTVSALLNSLQIGFKTLAIQKRSSEVWDILAAVKLEISKFGELLATTHRQLQTVSNTIEKAASKSRTIERKLRDVHELPSAGDIMNPALESV